ncbi:MAG TPA: Rv3235 family protein, partial [Streptosporangiaceae bacterium]|nr:Rv3235 family protein [Streptosporangiaceae bacterium]
PRAGPGDPQAQPRGEPGQPGRSGRTAPGQGTWPSQFAQALAEALGGSRPAQQLTPWTTEQTRQRIRQLGPLLATGQRPRLRRLMTSAPASDVLELTAVVGFGPRVRVLALRLERVEEPGEHWRCTEIESA